MGLSDFLGGTSQNRRENFYVFNPSPQKQLFLRCFPYIAPRHPVILRDTAGEKGYKQTDEMSFSTLPSLRATSPIFLRCKNTVEEEERHFLFQNKNGFVHLSPAMSRSITGYRNLKSKQGKREILLNLSPCVT